MIKDFIAGIKYLLLGFKLIQQPGIRPFVAIPLLINMIVFTAAIWFGTVEFKNLLIWLLPAEGSWWADMISGILWLLFGMIIMLILVFTFTLIANLIAAPFNGLLSEKTEIQLTGSSDSSSMFETLKIIPKALISEVRKLIYFLLWAIPLIVFSFIPVVNIAAPLLWALFSSWILSLEYIAYPMENNNIFFKEARTSIRKKRALSFGFGAAAMVTALIPVVNFLLMPAAVTGATAMYVDHFRK